MNTKFLWEHLNCRDIFGDVRVGNRGIKVNIREVLMKMGAEFKYSRTPIIWKLVIRIGSVLRVNLSRILEI